MEYMIDRKDAEIRHLRAELERRDIEEARNRGVRIVFEMWLVCFGIVVGAVLASEWALL